jgi:hypothetical protein
MRGRLVATSQRREHIVEPRMDLCLVRAEVHGRRERLGGLIESPAPRQGHTEVISEDGSARCKPHRLAKVHDRAGEGPSFDQGDAEIRLDSASVGSILVALRS